MKEKKRSEETPGKEGIRYLFFALFVLTLAAAVYFNHPHEKTQKAVTASAPPLSQTPRDETVLIQGVLGQGYDNDPFEEKCIVEGRAVYPALKRIEGASFYSQRFTVFAIKAIRPGTPPEAFWIGITPSGILTAVKAVPSNEPAVFSQGRRFFLDSLAGKSVKEFPPPSAFGTEADWQASVLESIREAADFLFENQQALFGQIHFRRILKEWESAPVKKISGDSNEKA